MLFSRAIILHATLKLIPMLQEIRKGLQLYGISGLMEKHPEMCQPVCSWDRNSSKCISSSSSK